MMIMPKKPDAMSSTERMRKKKEREQAGIVLPDCRECGAKCTADYTIQNQLCSKCWKKTPEGRKEAIARTIAYRQMKKLAPEDREQKLIQFRLATEYHRKLAAKGVPESNISRLHT